ncbi:MAG: hypothetical protein Q7R73_03970 [bacterium]|nr:hypothetical protein [bacterium]
MARMDEQKARGGTLRFFDPRLNRVGFGIEIVLYNPKERTILIYSKEDARFSTPSLSVLPLDEIQRLTVKQLYVVARVIISEALRAGYTAEVGCLCAFQVHLAHLQEEKTNVSIYDVIDQMNRLVEFLYAKLSWQEVKDIVWSSLSHSN